MDDIETDINALLTAFPEGTRFSAVHACGVLDRGLPQTSRDLHQIRETLEDNPEGVQLTVKRGRDAGFRFVPGDLTD